MNEIIRDNGYKSRKLWFSAFAIVAIFGGWIGAGLMPSLVPMFATFVGGVLGVAGLFLTGNVATKLVGTKVPADPKPVTASKQALEVLPGTGGTAALDP
jgi:divalent metal cation (Fe/Co/Zn/Cd) transporter